MQSTPVANHEKKIVRKKISVDHEISEYFSFFHFFSAEIFLNVSVERCEPLFFFKNFENIPPHIFEKRKKISVTPALLSIYFYKHLSPGLEV